MAHPIDGIRSKIERAKQNIEEFQLRAAAFYGTNPCVVMSKDDPQRGQRIYYLASIEDIPHSLADIAADAIHNLRKPLDYIATRIEYAACGAKPKHQVYFPIGRDATHYETVRRACIKCAGQAAIDAFDATEPYQGGKGHAIWQLHQLDKPEKHEVPLTTSAGLSGVDVSGFMRDQFAKAKAEQPWIEPDLVPELFIRPADRMCPLKVGDELFAEPLDMEVQHERKFAFDVSFHQAGVIECEPALPTLHQFADLVGGIVTAFGPLL